MSSMLHSVGFNNFHFILTSADAYRRHPVVGKAVRHMSDSRPQARAIRVLLVDDHPTVRETLRRVLQAYPNIEVVGEASDGDEALAQVEHLQPAVVVMDINMPRMDGITSTRLIKVQ